jgi:hypothetical protein
MSACVNLSGMGPTMPKREPWHIASAAPVHATATYVAVRDVDIAGTARHAKNATYPARILKPGELLRIPNRSNTQSAAKLGKKYSTPNARSTCWSGYMLPK